MLPCGHNTAVAALDLHLSDISSSGNNFWSMIPGKMFFASSWLTHSPQNHSWGETDTAADQFVFPEMDGGNQAHGLEERWFLRGNLVTV